MISIFSRIWGRFPLSPRRTGAPGRSTRFGMGRCLTLAFIACLACAAGPAADFGSSALTNESIVSYTQSRVSPSEIIAKINSSESKFDLSPEGVINLKHNGVSDDVLAVMTVAASRAAARAAADSAPAPIASAFDSPSLPPLPGNFAAVGAASSSPNDMRFNSELSNLASPVAEVRNAALAWMLANRETSLPLLRRALAGQDQAGQAAAALALGRMKDRESLNDMRRLIASASPMVRENVALSLAALGDVQSIAASEQALAQPSSAPLDGHIRLVGAARLVRASRQLGAILSDNANAENRVAAAWALAEIGPPASVAWPSVEKALTGDPEPAVRREAVRAVASLHDSSSARLLRAACRKDPDVRKITLQSMADYPETIEFLVGVMKLGSDQIAPDELDAARSSLQKLTGQDFALDGNRWSQWFATNRPQFGAPETPAPASSGLASAPAITDLSQLLGTVNPGPSEMTATSAQTQTSRRPEVDVAAWGIIVDSTLIPMAPEVDAAPSRPQMSGFPVSSGAGAMPASPLALSPSDFQAAPSGLGPESAVPSVPSANDLGGGSMFRTWSSDAGNMQAASSPAPEPPQDLGMQPMPGPEASGLADGETQLWGGYNAGDMNMPSMGDDSFSSLYPQPGGEPQAFDPASAAPYSTPLSSLPSSPIVAPQSASSVPANSGGESASSGLRGISLPLPGMGSSSSSSSTPPPSAPLYAPPPAEPAPALATETPADPFAGFGGSDVGSLSALEDPFADSAPPSDFPADFPEMGVGMLGDSVESEPEAMGGFLPPEESAAYSPPPEAPLDDPFAGFMDSPGFAETSALPVEESAIPQTATDTGDYNTLIFPGDSFGVGEPYFDQAEAPAFASPDEVPGGTSSSSPLGGLSLPLPTESAGSSDESVAPPASFSLRPPPAAGGQPEPYQMSTSTDGAETQPEEYPAVVPQAPGMATQSPVFVEPEPGQVVLGDDLFGDLPSIDTYNDGAQVEYVEPAASPMQGLSLPLPTETPQPVESEVSEDAFALDEEEDDFPDYPEQIAPPQEAQPESPVVVEMRVPGGDDEPAAMVISVEELGIVGEGGDIIDSPAEEIPPQTVGTDVSEGDDEADDGDFEEEGDEGLVSEVLEDVEEYMPPPPTQPSSPTAPASAPASIPVPVPTAQPSVHNEAQYVIKEIPPGIPVLSEDELYTDPLPGEEPAPAKSGGAATVTASPASSSPQVKAAQQPSEEDTHTRRRRNPPRHRR